MSRGAGWSPARASRLSTYEVTAQRKRVGVKEPKELLREMTKRVDADNGGGRAGTVRCIGTAHRRSQFRTIAPDLAGDGDLRTISRTWRATLFGSTPSANESAPKTDASRL